MQYLISADPGINLTLDRRPMACSVAGQYDAEFPCFVFTADGSKPSHTDVSIMATPRTNPITLLSVRSTMVSLHIPASP